jgi:hypothetical protein
MIISVIGNCLCLFNVTICFWFYENFKERQLLCYFDDQHKNDGNHCMKEWVHALHNSVNENWANINGVLLTNFSELLALTPYLLRAVRI